MSYQTLKLSSTYLIVVMHNLFFFQIQISQHDIERKTETIMQEIKDTCRKLHRLNSGVHVKYPMMRVSVLLLAACLLVCLEQFVTT